MLSSNDDYDWSCECILGTILGCWPVAWHWHTCKTILNHLSLHTVIGAIVYTVTCHTSQLCSIFIMHNALSLLGIDIRAAACQYSIKCDLCVTMTDNQLWPSADLNVCLFLMRWSLLASSESCPADIWLTFLSLQERGRSAGTWVIVSSVCAPMWDSTGGMLTIIILGSTSLNKAKRPFSSNPHIH